MALTQRCNEILAGVGGLEEYSKLIPNDCIAIPSISPPLSLASPLLSRVINCPGRRDTPRDPQTRWNTMDSVPLLELEEMLTEALLADWRSRSRRDMSMEVILRVRVARKVRISMGGGVYQEG